MVGSIENLEREIEQFQKNVMASSELVKLLNQMLDQIKSQNESFNQKSNDLISRIDKVPENIETANNTCNDQIKSDVANELEQSLSKFSDEQNQYIRSLEETRSQIQKYIEHSDLQKNEVDIKITDILKRCDLLIEQIKTDNDRTIGEIKLSVDKIASDRISELKTEQDKYIKTLDETKQAIVNQLDKLDAFEEHTINRHSELIKKVESTVEIIKKENDESVESIKKDNDEVLIKRNTELVEEFNKYISELKETQQVIKSSEKKLDESYEDFLNTLKKMNISNLYNQNQQLKDELNKRTTIIMIMAIVGIIIGILGLII